MQLLRKYIPLFLIFMLFGQEDMNSSSTNSETSGSIGTVNINGKLYNQLSLRPVIPIGKLSVGIDIYLYFNDEGLYWDSWKLSSLSSAYRTIIDKLYFLRWGTPNDDFYFMAGALPSVTLGSGILVDNYSNIIEYPQNRQIGLNLHAKMNGIGVELIHSNFKETSPGILGLRSAIDILPKLSMGISYVTDLDQYSGLKDRDGDSYPDPYDFYPDDSKKYDDSIYWRNIYEEIIMDDIIDEDFINWYQNSDGYNHYDPSNAKKDPVSAISIDIKYSPSNKLTLYSQFAKLIGKIDLSMLDTLIELEDNVLGWGLVPIGFRTKLGPINLVAEYRINSKRFIFNYWDRTYDVNRATLNSNGNVITRESNLYQFGKLNGFYVQSTMNIFNLLNTSIGYQNLAGEIWHEDSNEYKSDESNQTFFTTIKAKPTLIPKLRKLEAYYQQSNVPNLFKYEPNGSTIHGYNIGIEMSLGVMLVYKARTSYLYNIDLDEYDSVETIQIETKFIF